MEANGAQSARQRWTTLERRRKEPSLYDEWLNQEKPQGTTPPRPDTDPLRQGHTAQRESTGTIRAVTPSPSDENASDATDELSLEDRAIVPELETSSFERVFTPPSTTPTATGGVSSPAVLTSSPRTPAARLNNQEKEWERVAPTSPPSSRNGNRVLKNFTRRASKSNGQPTENTMGGRETYDATRPRTRTLEERRRELSPTAATVLKSRNRIGSTPPMYQGTEYLNSVPAATAPPAAPSLSALGFSMQQTVDESGRRSISPAMSDTAISEATQLPSASARRITHLMRTLNGRMSGTIQFRRGSEGPWTQSYCYVNEDSSSLLYESRSGGSAHRTLVPDLRGCYVRLDTESDTPYLELSSPRSEVDVHLKGLTQADFEAWFAILLFWQSQDAPREQQQDEMQTPPASSSDLPPRTSSAKPRERTASKGESKDFAAVNATKEAPVIKIGKMIFWDTNVGYSNSTATGQQVTRPAAHRMQSYATRRWQRISGQLRENGELKLHSDADNSLISVVQLSQLSRCAIQRLDPSVLDSEFCIAIYPQYTSTPSEDQPDVHRPIFLSLESRVLYEVWFVLLRAFTIPQLYGPSSAAEKAENGDLEPQDLEHMLTTTTADMFRVERSLNIRMIEAKMQLTSNGLPLKPDKRGYYAEILLDNETRARTTVKYDGSHPLWGESFEFLDLPPVLTSASVVVKRRPTDGTSPREQSENKVLQETYGLTGDQHGGYTNLTFDATVGKVEIYLQELEADKEVEKWWPIMSSTGYHVGDVLIRARADEGVILMGRDYQPLSDLLHRFSNAITVRIAHVAGSDLNRLSACLLNIFQVSGKANDWLMALAEDEIDGLHKETAMNRLRFNRRLNSNENDAPGSPSTTDRETLVRDMNKSATLEANLLFRGNTLLTKSLDLHMKRVGKEYLEESLGAIMRQLCEKDPDCEVDPNRVAAPQDLDRNWRRLLLWTQEVWKAIVTTKHRCPVELRAILRHIRACAEDRYGDFLRSVSYSSVSGFLFLRFFCPAVLNPKLFGLLKEDVTPRARRALTLIAKSLQTFSNMATFGTKEHWMEPMNAFLTQHREGFKTFIDDICFVPAPVSTLGTTSNSSPQYSPGVFTTETHLSYTTPMTIMQRLPATSREGFPSLPYLIDQARAYADLVTLWLEATNPQHTNRSTMRGRDEIEQMIQESGEDLRSFHEICSSLNERTQECLSRAERAERPNSAGDFQWDDVLNQLHSNHQPNNAESSDESSTQPPLDALARDTPIFPQTNETLPRPWERDHLVQTDSEDEGALATPPYRPAQNQRTIRTYETTAAQTRPGSSGMSTYMANTIQHTFRRALASRGSDHSPSNHSASASASASASNLSSAVNSDAEPPTALPSYELEVRRHQERREVAKEQIRRQCAEAEVREREKRERKARSGGGGGLGGLRKRREREREERKNAEGANGNGNSNGLPVSRGGDGSF